MKLDLARHNVTVGGDFLRSTTGWMEYQMMIKESYGNKLLNANEWIDLNGLAAFSFDRANHKFLRDAATIRYGSVMPQRVEHYYLISDYGIAWAFSVILQEKAVHIQSPIFSLFSLHHPDDAPGVARESGQIDHLTGKWDNEGLGSLHLTTVRDATGWYQADQVRYAKTATVLQNQKKRIIPVYPPSAQGPRPFLYLAFQDRDVERLVGISKTLGIGGSRFNFSAKFQTSLRYSKRCRQRVINVCNNFLGNGINVLDMRKNSSSWNSNHTLDISILTSSIDEPPCPAGEWPLLSYCDQSLFKKEYESFLSASTIGKTRIAQNKIVRINVGHGPLDAMHHPDECFLAIATNHQNQCIFDYQW